MAFELPPGSTVVPPQDLLWCKMYKESSQIAGIKVDLIKPDQSLRQVFFARVIKVGPGKMVDVTELGQPIRLPMLYKPGDDVLFNRFHGEPVTVGTEEFIVLKQDDIMLKIEIPEEVQGIYYTLSGEGFSNVASLEGARIIE